MPSAGKERRRGIGATGSGPDQKVSSMPEMPRDISRVSHEPDSTLTVKCALAPISLKLAWICQTRTALQVTTCAVLQSGRHGSSLSRVFVKQHAGCHLSMS